MAGYLVTSGEAGSDFEGPFIKSGIPSQGHIWADLSTTYLAQALRDYETLSANALPNIPIGARMIGRMGAELGEEPREPIFLTWLKRFIPFVGLVLQSDLLDLVSLSATAWAAIRILTGTTYLNFDRRAGPSFAVHVLEKSCGRLGFRELDQQGRLERAKKQAFAQRVLMGLFGGVALISPVLVMVLHPSRNINLITVSVATILFAVLLAIGASDGTGKDVLAATAAYAAVLVVFLGTSGASA